MRVRVTGDVAGPLSLFRLRQFKDCVQAVPMGMAGAHAVQDFEVDVIDELAVARLHRFLDLKFRLTGLRLEVLDELAWLPAEQH